MEVKVDANYLANRFISIDSDYDFPYDEEINVFPTFNLFDDTLKQYIDMEVEVNIDSTVNIAYPATIEDDDLRGAYVEKNIPYLLLKVTNKDVKDDIYNVTED
jgi:hypothetical protein